MHWAQKRLSSQEEAKPAPLKTSAVSIEAKVGFVAPLSHSVTLRLWDAVGEAKVSSQAQWSAPMIMQSILIISPYYCLAMMRPMTLTSVSHQLQDSIFYWSPVNYCCNNGCCHLCHVVTEHRLHMLLTCVIRVQRPNWGVLYGVGDVQRRGCQGGGMMTWLRWPWFGCAHMHRYKWFSETRTFLAFVYYRWLPGQMVWENYAFDKKILVCGCHFPPFRHLRRLVIVSFWFFHVIFVNVIFKNI
jgi:hypothetical protein